MRQLTLWEKKLDQIETELFDKRRDLSEINIVGLYMQDASQTRLLAFEEEIFLSKQYKENGTNSQIGKRARALLIQANTGLVVSIAKKYQGRGAPLEDIIQLGNLGLMRAVDKYDPDMGYRFSTYATYWIKQAITRGIPEVSRMVRIPVHAITKKNGIEKAKREIFQELEGEPGLGEIAKYLSWSPDKVAFYDASTQETLSLDQTVDDSGDATFGELLQGKCQSQDLAEISDILHAAINDLKPKERRVILMRNGFLDGEEWTLAKTGNALGITKEAARLTETKAIAILRRSLVTKHQLDSPFVTQ